MMATRSPGAMPDAIRPLATARTSSSNSAAVTSIQRVPSLREKATRDGLETALRAGRSARLPSVVGGTRGGATCSCTESPLTTGSLPQWCTDYPRVAAAGEGVQLKALSHRGVRCGTLVG